MPRFSDPKCPDGYGYSDDGSDNGPFKGYKLCKKDLLDRIQEATIGGASGSKYIVLDSLGNKIAYGEDEDKMYWRSDENKKEKCKNESFPFTQYCNEKVRTNCVEKNGVSRNWLDDKGGEQRNVYVDETEKKVYKNCSFAFHGRHKSRKNKSRKRNHSKRNHSKRKHGKRMNSKRK